jgi:hypothetical protein
MRSRFKPALRIDDRCGMPVMAAVFLVGCLRFVFFIPSAVDSLFG